MTADSVYAEQDPRLEMELPTIGTHAAIRAATLVALLTLTVSPGSSAPLLWSDQPAEKWGDAYPIGNGRLGGMVFGGVQEERIQLNEDTIWNGKKRDRDNPEALQSLPEMRQLLFDGKPLEATALADRKLMGIPNRQPPYQPLGDLLLTFPGLDDSADYRRELNLATGIVKVTYRVGDTRCTREVFTSTPDQVLVVHVACDKPGRVSLKATLTREQDSKTSAIAPGDVEVDAEWRDGRLVSAQLRPAVARERRLRPPRSQEIAAIRCGGRSVAPAAEPDGTYRVKLEAHESCAVSFR